MKVKIYLITNTAVNPYMYYVGLTKFDLDRRLQEHVSLGKHEGNKFLSDAIIEYGKRNFTIEVIEEVDESEARNKEDYYIRRYKSNHIDGGGYNMRYEISNYEKHYHGANQEQIQENIKNGRPWNYGVSFSLQSKEKMKKTKKHRYSLGLYTKCTNDQGAVPSSMHENGLKLKFSIHTLWIAIFNRNVNCALIVKLFAKLNQQKGFPFSS